MPIQLILKLFRSMNVFHRNSLQFLNVLFVCALMLLQWDIYVFLFLAQHNFEIQFFIRKLKILFS